MSILYLTIAMSFGIGKFSLSGFQLITFMCVGIVLPSNRAKSWKNDNNYLKLSRRKTKNDVRIKDPLKKWVDF